jgi:hypothetical protein
MQMTSAEPSVAPLKLSDALKGDEASSAALVRLSASPHFKPLFLSPSELVSLRACLFVCLLFFFLKKKFITFCFHFSVCEVSVLFWKTKAR